MSDDTISRRTAIDATKLLIKDLRKDAVDVMNFGHNYNHGVADAIATLKHLPSAERRGRWLRPYYNKQYKKCSVCESVFSVNLPKNANYCPNCGARMEATR